VLITLGDQLSGLIIFAPGPFLAPNLTTASASIGGRDVHSPRVSSPTLAPDAVTPPTARRAAGELSALSGANGIGRIGRSPINVPALIARLRSYPRRRDREILGVGFQLGFSIGVEHAVDRNRVPKNLASARSEPEVVRQKIAAEVAAGRFAGPFDQPPLEAMLFSPLGLVPKREIGKFRLIHHLSWPVGRGVNAAIPDSVAAVKYTKFDTVISKIKTFGTGTLLWKADIKDAFRLLPVRQADQRFLGFTFDEKFYLDLCLSFGLRSSCAIFEKFSKFLNFTVSLGMSKNQDIQHYIDDFIGMIKADAVHEPSQLDYFKNVCVELGVPLAEHKFEGPCTRLTFLGLEIDTIQMQVRVPVDKVEATREKIQQFLQSKRISLQKLQSLLGSLSFLCRAVRPGRVFTRRLFDLTKGVKKPFYKIRITKQARLDASLWLTFLQDFNGISPILDSQWDGPNTLRLVTDASSLIGFGGYFQTQWFKGIWPTSLRRASMALLEIFPIVLAVLTFYDQMCNKRLLIFCDNEAVTIILKKQTSKCPKIMCLLRKLTLACLKFNIVIQARHLSAVDNGIADSLSRARMDRFRALAPEARLEETQTPLAEVLFSELKLIV
jgi:hypothetical protein